MSNGVLTGIIIGFSIGGIAEIAFIIAAAYMLKIRNLIKNTPTSRVEMIRTGLTELSGKVLPVETLKSPVSGKDCVYFKLEVKELRSNGKSSHWVTIRKIVQSKDFYLDDGGSYKALISFELVNVKIKRDVKFSSGMFKELPENVQRVLQELNIRTKFLNFNRTLRVEESYLEPGDAIYVLGFAEMLNDGRNKARFKLRKEKSFPYILSDLSEKEVQRHYGIIGAVFSVLAGILLIGAIVFFYLQRNGFIYLG